MKEIEEKRRGLLGYLWRENSKLIDEMHFSKFLMFYIFSIFCIILGKRLISEIFLILIILQNT